MSFLSSLFGHKPRAVKQDIYTPQQSSAMNELLQMALSGLKGTDFGFEPIAQQARSSFFGDTVPTLAERFTSMGQGSQGSSGFQGALGRAGAGMEEQLAGMGSQYNLQRQQGLMSLLSPGLSPQYNTMMMPQQQGLLGQGLGLAGQASKLFGLF